jgi:3-phenylpropionate/trans-cinnamate dioxygenase ferredoxin subunit
VRVRVCSTDELLLDEVRVIRVDDRRIAVFHTEHGVFAVDDRCTHQEAALSEGFVEGCEVECPLHASSFDLRTGAPSGPPASQPVATYPTDVVDGSVFVQSPVERS